MTLDPVVVFTAIGAILTAVVGAGVRGVWVWGWTFSEMRTDRNFWRETALKSMGHTDKAINVAEKVSGG